MDPFLSRPGTVQNNRNLLRLRVIPVSEYSNVASGQGQIIQVSKEAEWGVIKRLCVAAIEGKEKARDVQLSLVRVYLLPGGEEIYDTRTLREADSVGVHIGPSKLYPHDEVDWVPIPDPAHLAQHGKTDSESEYDRASVPSRLRTDETSFSPSVFQPSHSTVKAGTTLTNALGGMSRSKSLHRQHSRMTFKKAVRKLVLMNRVLKTSQNSVKYKESEKWSKKDVSR